MPIPYHDGLFLEFDAPLTKPRHDLIVAQLAQVGGFKPADELA